MIKKIIINTMIIIAIYIILGYNRCSTTSYFWWNNIRKIGIDSYICCGTVRNADYDHVWIRINNINIETGTLGLIKSPYVDYNNPYFISNNIEEIKYELFDQYKNKEV